MSEYVKHLKRLKSVLKREMLLDVDHFLDKLVEKDLITTAQEMELKGRSAYEHKVDGIFHILTHKNVKSTYYDVERILEEMDRCDIIVEMMKQYYLLILECQSQQSFSNGVSYILIGLGL